MLLSNLTKLDSAAKELVETKIPGSSLGLGADEELTSLELLLAAFDQGAAVQSSTTNAALEEMKKKAQEAAKAGVQMATEEEEKKKLGGRPDEQERKSTCHFLASVFANVTAVSIDTSKTLQLSLSLTLNSSLAPTVACRQRLLHIASDRGRCYNSACWSATLIYRAS